MDERLLYIEIGEDMARGQRHSRGQPSNAREGPSLLLLITLSSWEYQYGLMFESTKTIKTKYLYDVKPILHHKIFNFYIWC